jgi:23S rRNA (guanosine2251-2'-O)-methyltransferase
VADRKPRWVVGVHACQEALKTSPQSIKEIHFQDLDNAKSPSWEPYLRKVRVRPTQKSVNFFKDLSEFGHQGVALATDYEPEWKTNPDGPSLVLFLDGLEDPHNFGAIIRTSWLMSVDGIYVPEERAVRMTPTVCKVASGGCEHVPVEETHFLSAMKRLKDEGYWIYGFSDKATQSLYQVQFPPKTVLIVGNEEKGIRLPVTNQCDEILSIPQAETGSSYNVSVAIGIAMAEVNRQIRWKPS